MFSRIWRIWFLVLGLCMMLGTSARADVFYPATGPALSGPLIQYINTDKVYYRTGDTAHVYVYLFNQTSSPFTGTIYLQVSGRGVPVGTKIATSVSTLNPNDRRIYDISVPTYYMVPYQGYFADITVVDTSSNQIDEQSVAIDFTPNWWTYPRLCHVSSVYTQYLPSGYIPGPIKNVELNLSRLNSMSCNNIEIYDAYYRAHLPLGPTESYTTADGEVVNKSLIRRAIASAKKQRMGVLFGVPMHLADIGVSPNFTQDGSGVNFNWAGYKDRCATTNSCTIESVVNINGQWSAIDFTNPDWQSYWASRISDLVKAYGVDGIYARAYITLDTKYYYTSKGQTVDYTRAYSTFLQSVFKQARYKYILDTSDGTTEADLFQSGIEAYHAVTRVKDSNNISSFTDLVLKAQTIMDQTESLYGHNLGMDWNAGINANTASGNLNKPGVLYFEATTIATGAHHSWMFDSPSADNEGVRYNYLGLTMKPFVQNSSVGSGLGLGPVLRDYQTFLVAYEKLLRRDTGPVKTGISGYISNKSMYTIGVSPGTTRYAVSITPSAGTVSLIRRARPGLQTISVLNYTALSQAQMTDPFDDTASLPEAPLLKTLNVVMYIDDADIPTLGTMYWASPDVNHGKPNVLPYTVKKDSYSNYIQFVIPTLKYFDFIWIEMNTASSDYATP